MTEAQKELYVKTKERLRRLGKENPADVIIALAEEVEQYRAKIRAMEDSLDKAHVVNRLLERDIADRDAMLEQKVEEVYADFMRDYKCMREELEGACEELTEAREELSQYKKLSPIGCPQCHRGCFSNDKFCSHCGVTLKKKEDTKR